MKNILKVKVNINLKELKKKTIRMVLSILLCQSAGIIGSIFTFPAISGWYATLNKPFFQPPGWLFGPVWLLLYTLMGIAYYYVWQKSAEDEYARFTAIFFVVHLAFNAAWSIVFFGLHNIILALIVLGLMWAMILVLIFLFWRIKNIAGYLLLPYFFWTSFAFILNYTIVLLN